MDDDSESGSTEEEICGVDRHPVSGQEITHLPGNELVPHCSESQLTAASNRNQLIPSETVITGGSFPKAVFGPQTNEVSAKVKNYHNSKITVKHYHSKKRARRRKKGKKSQSSEEYTSSSSDSDSSDYSSERGRIPRRRGRDDPNEGYSEISKGIYIYGGEPLRKGTKVYKGYQLHASGNRRNFAIKMIFPCDDTNIREVECLLKLASHPNVVQIIHSEEKRTPFRILYIAMELCGSQNLNDFLTQNRAKKASFNFMKTMSLARQIIEGVRHIHCNKIIHRDLKPENLLLSQCGEQIKVSDFGISKQLRPNSSATRQTQPGLGTDGFRSPEAYGEGPISLKSDIFSLGLTLYSLFSYGEHAFGSDPHLYNKNITTNQGCDLSQLLVSGAKKEELLDLIKQTLHPDPSKRPSIEEIADHAFFRFDESKVVTTRAIDSREQPSTSSQPDLSPQPVNEEDQASNSPLSVAFEELALSSEDEYIGHMEELVTQSEERCRRLMDENKFVEAISILENLGESKRQSMLSAECHIMLGNEEEAKACLWILKQRVAVAPSSFGEREYVLKTVASHIERSQPVRAIILLKYAFMLISQLPGVYKLTGICDCAFRCTDIMRIVYLQGTVFREICPTFVIQTLYDILYEVNAVHASPHLKLKSQLSCLNEIGVCYHEMEKSEIAIGFYEQGVAALRNVNFQVASVRIHGILFHNFGVAHADLGNFDESERYFSWALGSLGKAIDFPTVEEKLFFLRKIRSIQNEARVNLWSRQEKLF